MFALDSPQCEAHEMLNNEFFNAFNRPNFANPISNLNAAFGPGGKIDPSTGQVLNAGNFGRIISTSNNPRIVQLCMKFFF
jgi:hypothetical protein